MPVVRTDGRPDVRSRDYQISRMGKLPRFLRYGATLSRANVELRYHDPTSTIHHIWAMDVCRYFVHIVPLKMKTSLPSPVIISELREIKTSSRALASAVSSSKAKT